LALKIDPTERFLALEIDGQLSDSIIPVEFEGREGVSELYRYTVHIVSSDMALQARKLLVAHGLEAAELPVVAAGAHTADPGFTPVPGAG